MMIFERVMSHILFDFFRRFGFGGRPCCEVDMNSCEGRRMIILHLRELQWLRDRGSCTPSLRDLSTGASAEVFVRDFLDNLKVEVRQASSIPVRHRGHVWLRILVRYLVSMVHLSSNGFAGYESAFESALKKGAGLPFLDWSQFKATRDYLQSIGAADRVAYSVEVAGHAISLASASEVSERLRQCGLDWRVSHPAWGGGCIFREGAHSTEILSSGFCLDDSGVGVWPLGVLSLVEAIEAVEGLSPQIQCCAPVGGIVSPLGGIKQAHSVLSA